MQELEIKKKKLTTRSSELTLAIDRLKAEIDKATHKLRFSHDIEMMLSSDKGGNFTFMHLIIAFIIGFFIGYLFLNAII
ncbi:unnamed protein product [Blepharisma stoltei]|uniref:Uncharacterized protein n=1 Tax=Blepharisma stoltei TaxID=1481888 RepID=A0AAU9I4I7_9CILI|nr:unnamed protein product [Blepharisma stoltei]